MPRRTVPDPLALEVGQRIRKLREELGLTMEQLAYESELGSKGHLSNLERGLARPTVHTLKVLADRLGVSLLDMVTFPDHDARQKYIDRTRFLPRGAFRNMLKDLPEPKKEAPTPKKKEASRGAPASRPKPRTGPRKGKK